MAEAAVHIDLKPVVGTDALREPMRRIPYGIVGQWRARWVVICPIGIACRARRRRANRRCREVRIKGEQFVVGVRADVADSQRSARRELLLDFQAPGLNGWRLEVWLDATRDH